MCWYLMSAMDLGNALSHAVTLPAPLPSPLSLSLQEEGGPHYPDMDEAHMYESLQLQYEELYQFLKENSRKSKVSSHFFGVCSLRARGWRETGSGRVEGLTIE